MSKKNLLLLLTITILGAFLRFYNLNWGGGYFFHPDERNIASAVSQLEFPEELNPHFFAYGAFPIYLVYLFGVSQNFLGSISSLLQPSSPPALQPSIFQVQFAQAILIGRGLSALLSTLMIPLVYFLTRKVLRRGRGWRGDRREEGKEGGFALLAAVLIAFLPGLIQFAHFSTFEIFLTVEYLLILWAGLNLIEKGRLRDYLLLGILVGLSIATKIVSLVLLPAVLLSHFLCCLDCNRDRGYKTLLFSFFSKKLLLGLLIALLVAFVASPFNLLDFGGFKSSMTYEGGVAQGTLPVFYTAHFLKTTPIFYQIFHVLPYLMGWPLTVLGVVGVIWAIKALIKRYRGNKGSKFKTAVLLLIPALYLGFHLVLFVRWVRYMVPVLPFTVILTVVFLSNLHQFLQRLIVKTQNSKLKTENNRPYHSPASNILQYSLILSIALLFSYTAYQGFSFFTIYTHPDTRVQAARWAAQNLPQDAKIMSETWDLGIIPFNDYFPIENIKLFNAYELDGSHGKVESEKLDDLEHQEELQKLLAWTDYIVIPSRRIYESRLALPELFPDGAKYYQDLFTGKLGFEKIAEFDNQPCLISKNCFLLPNEDKAEQTFEVFDHPKVIIFKKVN